MLKFYPVLFSVFCLFLGKIAFSQCPGANALSFTFTSLASSCEANGEITVTVAGGVPFTGMNNMPVYSNSILAGPVTYPAQSAETFTALPSGTYTVEVADACGTTVTQSIQVAGTYMLPDLAITVTDSECLGLPRGEISIQAFDGKPPYSYRLIDLNVMPPDTIGIQADSIFPNVSAGDYQVQLFDDCDNFQTRDVVVGEVDQGIPFPLASTQLFGCDSFVLIISNVNVYGRGLNPVNWEVISAVGESGLVGISGQLDSDNDVDSVFHSIATTFVVEVTDACGTTVTTTSGAQPDFIVPGSTQYNCATGNSLFISINFGGNCDTFTYEIIQGPVVRPPQGFYRFDNLPPGLYTYEVTDCCGKTATNQKEIIGPAWTARGISEDDESCEVGTTRIRFTTLPNGGPSITGPYYHYLYAAPPGVTVPDTIFQAWPENGQIQDAPVGTYCWFTEDACGRRDSACFVADQALLYDMSYQINLDCISGNSVTINHTSTSNDIEFLVDTIGAPIFAINSSTQWDNLIAGKTYFLASANDRRTCILQVDTFTIPEYIQPFLQATWGVECTSGEGTISSQASGGQPPYTYELFSGPVTRPLQTSPVFNSLPAGTYDMRVFDDCNNSFITSVSIETFVPQITGYYPPFCIGDPVSLSIDNIDGATYSWTGPSGNIGNSHQIDFQSVSVQDTGTYTVIVNIPGCTADTIDLDMVVQGPCGPILDLKVLLEGPYDSSTGLMSDNLRASGLIPLLEPYSGLSYNPVGGGGETIDPAVLDVTGPDAIVDWIFLEVRSAVDITVAIASRSALLQADGSVVDLDGVSPVTFDGVVVGAYYIVVSHRNHLDIMTPGGLILNEVSANFYDFTTGAAFGAINGPVQKHFGGGVFGMFECDYNQNGEINAGDRSLAWNFRNQTGYLSEDSNFDGVCDAAERSQCWNNRNRLSYVP